MTFDALLDQVRALVQSKGRVAYRALKRRFALDDEYLEDLKAELINAEQVAYDEDGTVLVWRGHPLERSASPPLPAQSSSTHSRTQQASSRQPVPAHQDAERHQLTVLFCDLVGSTALSTQLDPEELREVVRSYQETCTAVTQHYAGYIAQHLGDGLLVYFGCPVAHEDDAQRAVLTGLEIIDALRASSLQHRSVPQPLSVRIGIHTGLVVIGEIGGSAKREMLALGETPNIAARVQGIAEPDTVVISPMTQRLVQGLFACQDLGPQSLKGLATPLLVYRVLGESAAQSRFEAAVGAGLTPLVGRTDELRLLQQRWAQAKEGAGQVVLLSGEPGIGKSRLMRALTEQVSAEAATCIEVRCSPYHQHSALYPLIDCLQRVFHFAPQDSPQTKRTKLHHALTAYRFPQAETLPLLATLLSLPQPSDLPALTLTPQQQKQHTQAALLAWLREEAEKAPLYCTWEDLHWADPSTLEFLTLFMEQLPTTRTCAVLTFRLDFTPPWPCAALTPLTLQRLERAQVEAMVMDVTGGKALPQDVLQQIVHKTDGVPLFVEELTKMVLESGWLQEEDGRYVWGKGGASLPSLAIPSTLQDSLMARLDRLAPVRELAQVGAVLGREFRYEFLQAVSGVPDHTLQEGLRQLVEAALLYQHGQPPQAMYLFKHALIQETAYHSLLKSRRQQLHAQCAQVLAEQFPETVEAQPELLAHHYTEAGLIASALPYWQKAGQRASHRLANAEAVSHFTKGLALLHSEPETSDRMQQELTLQLALGPALVVLKGTGSPEVNAAYARALVLCQQLGETPQLLPALLGLWAASVSQGKYQQGRELAEQCLRLAQSVQDRTLLLQAHFGVGTTLFFLGEFVGARAHVEQALTLYDPLLHNPRVSRASQDPAVVALTYLAWLLWFLGYPEQAMAKAPDALALGEEFAHPYSKAWALNLAAKGHLWRREGAAAQERAEAMLRLAHEHAFPYWLAEGTMLRGRALAEQGRDEEGIAQMRQGLAAWRATGAAVAASYFLTLPVEAYGRTGRTYPSGEHDTLLKIRRMVTLPVVS